MLLIAEGNLKNHPSENTQVLMLVLSEVGATCIAYFEFFQKEFRFFDSVNPSDDDTALLSSATVIVDDISEIHQFLQTAIIKINLHLARVIAAGNLPVSFHGDQSLNTAMDQWLRTRG